MKNLNLKDRTGFTLIELMIAIAIIAILSTLAVTSYQSYLIKSRRTAAYVMLQQMMNYAQQYYAQNNFTYPTSLAALYGSAPIPSSPYYTFSSVACTSANCGTPCFQIEATAATGTSQTNDTGCTKLDLDSCGNRMPTTGNCWNVQ